MKGMIDVTITIDECALTTVDNPWDPIDDFDNWYRFDMDKGYSSLCYLARVAKIKENMTEREAARETERAIDQIVLSDPLNLYTKVKKPVTYDYDDE